MNSFSFFFTKVLNYQTGNENKRLDYNFVEATDGMGSVNCLS